MTNILGLLIGYGIMFGIIIGIAYVAHFFITPQSELSGAPQLNSTWITQFMTTVANARNQRYSECSQLDALAQQNYNNYYLNANETVLAPMYLETNYIDGVASSTSYGVNNPTAYLQNLENNYSEIYSKIMNKNYNYYGYYLYQTEAQFGSSSNRVDSNNITANAINVFVELAPSCN